MPVVVSCMDRRLNRYLDELNDGDTIFVRNAGANIGSLRDTLRHLIKADEIIVLPHTDCGAMGVVQRALSGERFSEILNPLIGSFSNLRVNGRNELERENLEV
jgi:carbonic anhydrase